MTSPLLNTGEACQRLGVSRDTFARWEKRGWLNRAKALRPLGQRKWIAAELDRINQGGSQPLVRRA